MKKIFAVVLLGMFALAGCNDGDNGELAGVYLGSDKDKLILNAKDGEYQVGYQYEWKGKYGSVQYVGFTKRDGNYLVSKEQNDKKMFEIKKDELISVYTSKKTVYKKIDN